MYLKIQWDETRVPPAVIHTVEAEIEDFLVAHFGSASAAFNTKVAFSNQLCPPNHPWNIGLNKAIALATRDLLPSIQRDFRCRIGFFDD